MRDVVVNTMRIPVASSARGAVLEIEVVAPARPGRWRLRLALWLVKMAGKLARMRVRVIDR